jgi:hypothetical protein
MWLYGSEYADAEDAIAAKKETMSGFIVGRTEEGAHLAEVAFIDSECVKFRIRRAAGGAASRRGPCVEWTDIRHII